MPKYHSVFHAKLCSVFGRSRDTMGTKSERQNRLSVVLSDPIVKLAQNIFKGLLDLDKMNCKENLKTQINHNNFPRMSERVIFKPKIAHIKEFIE